MTHLTWSEILERQQTLRAEMMEAHRQQIELAQAQCAIAGHVIRLGKHLVRASRGRVERIKASVPPPPTN